MLKLLLIMIKKLGTINGKSHDFLSLQKLETINGWN